MNKKNKHTINFSSLKAGKNCGFSIPQNYFEEIEEKINTSIFIDSLPKKKTFNTPDDYFDTIETQILSKLVTEQTTETKVISLRKRILQYIPLAAAASVLLFIGFNYFNTQKITFEDITITDIESWYENGYGDIDNNELAATLNTSELDEDILASISDETLEDYLNSVDTTTLINEIEQ
ncbi:hypothetical protein MHM83_15640 [Tenacibaculum sp. Mcav3-52]|uniref:Uncharacterized protein n=2 Tax=Tenacibaculum TaxID=104267 RepID=A0AAE9ML51_9FLAO|nr:MULTISPECIES: hypothetical protein [Tenacibaculum]GFD76783.1 hypothetical protein KUL113_62030 [Tenacibaculum sp. KUL113]GFD81892.1 hypothetical protein KUL118_47540 [Tenacibaculum sp. KUL118]MCG7503300.1 hypothetical protein [Tenacibaculum sp. Mcav3-52]MCO7186565.1 hypothetical protein [Tenacibaculum sp. XPcli2-G]UTD14004.1 hypothetical protein HER15_00290 [Tenacibaculum mesophilum]|eukprot:TRINITY_DN3831_c0_g2_i2.p1 TRINITY_DN3831_c0_g2~~TRINITY_DN3831_c0_g2_i2.p1  ORF type:complete len:179 (+),score=35.39 TRINITY_DN3831_c0_g2_i2:624-1160(+)